MSLLYLYVFSISSQVLNKAHFDELFDWMNTMLRLQEIFNYDIDSDEEWIDEPGENLSDDVSTLASFRKKRERILSGVEECSSLFA